MLKRQQKAQGNELVKLGDETAYPGKIKQLMEELRFAKEKQLDLQAKLSDEKSGLTKQNERLSNLEARVQLASQETSQEFDSNSQVDDGEEQGNKELINKIIELEKNQAEKIQENRLLMLKYKNIQVGGGNQHRSLSSLKASRDSQYNSALQLPGPGTTRADVQKNELTEFGVKKSNYISARGSAKKLVPIEKQYGLNTIEQTRSNSVLNKMAQKNQ